MVNSFILNVCTAIFKLHKQKLFFFKVTHALNRTDLLTGEQYSYYVLSFGAQKQVFMILSSNVVLLYCRIEKL